MKLIICLVLAVVACTSADQSFYQPQPAAQSSAQPTADHRFYQQQPGVQSSTHSITSSYGHYDYDDPTPEKG